MDEKHAWEILKNIKGLQDLKVAAENLGNWDLAEIYYQAWKASLDLKMACEKVVGK